MPTWPSRWPCASVGCGDGLDFTHATYLQVTAERTAFAGQLDALERAARQDNPIREPIRRGLSLR